MKSAQEVCLGVICVKSHTFTNYHALDCIRLPKNIFDKLKYTITNNIFAHETERRSSCPL